MGPTYEEPLLDPERKKKGGIKNVREQKSREKSAGKVKRKRKIGK